MVTYVLVLAALFASSPAAHALSLSVSPNPIEVHRTSAPGELEPIGTIQVSAIQLGAPPEAHSVAGTASLTDVSIVFSVHSTQLPIAFVSLFPNFGQPDSAAPSIVTALGFVPGGGVGISAGSLNQGRSAGLSFVSPLGPGSTSEQLFVSFTSLNENDTLFFGASPSGALFVPLAPTQVVTATAVPEPGAALLFLGGGAIVGWSTRRLTSDRDGSQGV